MAIKLIGNYAKRLGLPGYSSHQFSVSCETELTDIGQVQGEAARLYNLLQDAVDREIQQTGFVPGHDYGEVPNGHSIVPFTAPQGDSQWSCSGKQKEFILKLVTEHDLDRDAVDDLARSRFGSGVKQLNKLQASGLINELLESSGNHNGKTNGKRSMVPANGRKGGGR